MFSPLKEAWRDMYQARTCPPCAVLNNPVHAENVAEHRKGCPLCAATQNKAAHDFSAWAELGQRLAQDLPSPVTPLKIQPGQIWNLKPHKGGWDTRWRHINPPLVLILEILNEVDGVRVAQIFDQPELAAAGDVPIGDGLALAQTWNTYTLDQDDLDFCLGQVNPDIKQNVIDAADQELDHPEEGETRWYFRQLELEVGAAMATEALGRLMQRHDRHQVRTLLADPATVRAQVLAFNPDIILPDAPDGLLLLAKAQLPAQRLAAADSQQCTIVVVTLGQKMTACRSALAELDRAQLEGSTIYIGGTLPADARSALLFAWWSRSDLGMTEGEVTYDPATGFFRADFLDKTSLDFKLGQLVLLGVDVDHATH